MELNDQINKLFRESIEKESWEYAKFITVIDKGGSSKPNILLFDNEGRSRRFIPDQIFKLNKLAKTNFTLFFDNETNRFNKVEFTIYSDGTYQADYRWEVGEAKSQKANWAKVLPQWVNDRLISLLFSAGYGDETNWQQGVFTFTIQQGHLSFEGVLYDKQTPITVHLQLPDYLTDGIMEHYQITNEGELQSEWKPWNQMQIRSPHNDLDLEKDVTYQLIAQ